MKEVIVSSEVLIDIRDIPWLINCGKEENLRLSCAVQHVAGWEEAEKYDELVEWDEVITKSREELANFVFNRLGYSVRVFNSVVASVRDSDEYKLSVTNLENMVVEKNIKEEFFGTLNWLLLNGGIEAAFKDFKGCPTFFREMLVVLKAGHCPCGWTGRWPKGKLYIY